MTWNKNELSLSILQPEETMKITPECSALELSLPTETDRSIDEIHSLVIDEIHSLVIDEIHSLVIDETSLVMVNPEAPQAIHPLIVIIIIHPVTLLTLSILSM